MSHYSDNVQHTEWLKRLIESISFFTILYIFISYGYQYFYFGHFHINIAFYQTTTGLIFSPIGIVLWITMSCVVVVLVFYVLLLVKPKNIFAKLPLKKSIRALALLVLLAATIDIYLLRQGRLDDYLYYVAFTCAALFTLGLFSLSFWTYERILFLRSREAIHFKIIPYVVCMSTLIFFLKIVAKYDYLHVKTVGSKQTIVFLLKGIRYQTTDSFFQIGETPSQIFFFNKSDTSTRIFNKSEMDSLVIK